MQDLEKRPDYKKQVNEELDRIEHRAMVLNDVLNSKPPQDRKQPDANLDVSWHVKRFRGRPC